MQQKVLSWIDVIYILKIVNVWDKSELCKTSFYRSVNDNIKGGWGEYWIKLEIKFWKSIPCKIIN